MSTSSIQIGAATAPPLARKRAPYEPAVSPSLKIVLLVLFLCMALLGVTGIYLLALRVFEAISSQTYVKQFTFWMLLGHIVVGVVVTLPFLCFGVAHWWTARRRPNRYAVKLGLGLFSVGMVVAVSGLALIQLSGMPQLQSGSVPRWVVYGLHVAAPVLMVVLYVLHRRAGPDIQWKWGYGWAGFVALFVVVMVVWHAQDPRKWGSVGPRDGEKYFEPSKARTATGDFISASALMMDEYCMKCHPDIYQQHLHSAHRFSSFNNPLYRFSVNETRRVGIERDHNPQASRWCAGCHDTAPFFSGAFDDPNFDDQKHPTAKAGLTCVTCHAITNVNSTMGNADYTIEEPEQYPFAYSDNAFLQWVNNQLIKAKPDFHKKTFLKPFHKSANGDKASEFCSTCHKVSIPVELNHYKEFLRGQNHYDPFLLSGVSGHGARSFYYPPVAKNNCANCHMPFEPSNDFGSRDFDGSGIRKVHSHAFPAANTAIPWLMSLDATDPYSADAFRKSAKAHEDFLRGTDLDGKDKKLRIDLFGLKMGPGIDAELVAPLRPKLPALQPGQTYLIEVVIRTVNIGHLFSQGTVDSNEIWVDFTARSGDRIIGRSGSMSGPDDTGSVDEWAHRVNVLMLDKDGNRINRRNPQDIFTPLYNHQIPPGAGQVVHYRLTVSPDVTRPIDLDVRLRYRKFDYEYTKLVYQERAPQNALGAVTGASAPIPIDVAYPVPKLPIVDICADHVTLPVVGVAEKVPEQTSPIKEGWQRWNDYGIGCLIEGGAGSKKGELKQAEQAFKQLLSLDKKWHAHGHLNLARVYLEEGRLPEAVDALNQAAKDEPPAYPWTHAWLSGEVNLENASTREDFDNAIASFESVLDPANQPSDRHFDFTKDYLVINRLGKALFQRAQKESDPAVRDPFLLRAVEQYKKTLELDKEDLDAHFGLSQCYMMLGLAHQVDLSGERKTDEPSLHSLSATLRDGKQPKAARLAAADELAAALSQLQDEPVVQSGPKRFRFEGLIRQLGPVFLQEQDAHLRAAEAQVLARVHSVAHATFKPDEIANAKATSIYRQNHPAANHAAEAIVIYPLNRAGAPGQ
jgi:tetratricopeptide (TPR) repeat protein